MDFISLGKSIKNTFTHGTVLTEHWLNTSRRRQTPKKTRKSPHTTGLDKRKAEKEEEIGRDQDPTEYLKRGNQLVIYTWTTSEMSSSTHFIKFY